MKLAFTTDLHVDPTKIKDSKIGMMELVRTLDDQAVDILCIAGDIFDNFNVCGRDTSFGTVFETILTPLKDFLSQSEKRKVIMIPGNHDMSTRKDQKDALYGFEYQDKIIISHSIQGFYLAKGVCLATLPWMYPSMYKSKDEVLSSLITLRQLFRTNHEGILQPLSILLGHCEIKGAVVPSGYTLIGGHFSFTMEELNNLGYDEIFLGHIHKQQLHYIGSPWQHNFGEEGLQGSIEVLDIKQSVITRETIEIKNTPKYYTIKPEEISTIKYKQNDHVKVRGKSCSQLPTGFIFEKEIDEKQFRIRSDVTINDDVKTLLKKWLVHNETKVSSEKLFKTLLELDLPKDFMYKGSLEKIHSLELTNIGTHKNTKLSFNDGITAITGSNGSGKTIFIESVIAALYGEYPSYGYIDNLVPEGKRGNILMHFTSKGIEYILNRTVSSTHTAFLYKKLNVGQELIVGPKVGEVRKYIENLVGPKELLLSSVFSSQFFEGDITEIPLSDRKKVFSKLLGFMHLEEIHAKIGGKMLAFKIKQTDIENQIEGVNLDTMAKLVQLSKEKLEKDYKDLNFVSNQILILEEDNKKLLKETKDMSQDISEFKETKGITEKLKEQKKSGEQLQKLNLKISQFNSDIKAKYDKKESVINQHKSKIDDLDKTHKLLNDAGCKETPLECSFISDAIAVPKEKESLTSFNNQILADLDKEIEILKSNLNISLVLLKTAEELSSKQDIELEDLTHKNSRKLEAFQDRLNLAAYNLKKVIDNLKEKEKEQSSYEIEIAKEKKELSFHQRKLQKLGDDISIQEEIEKKIATYDVLERAFNRDGIPQLLIDAALPQLQEVLNILSSYLKKFSIEVTTQTELKSGGAKETIGFLVNDGIKVRDIKYFSGGERKLLKGFIRTALSLFQAQRTGGRYKMLFLDEAFDSLDRDRSMLLIRILSNLSELFNQIFIVSHTNDLLGQFGKVIIFENKNNETSFNTI